MQTAQDKLDDSRAALERKAALYDKLAAGQYNDDGEVYNVNFLQKGTLEEEQQYLQHEASARGQHLATENAPVDTAASLVSSAGEPLASIGQSMLQLTTRHRIYHYLL